MAFHENTIYVVGDAKSPLNNPITEKFKSYFIGLVIDRTTDVIIDVECSATVTLTNQFVRSMMVGKHLFNSDIIDSINTRYFGASQKALVVALKDAQKKYQQIKQSDAK